jgi:hypothetical protein
VGAQEEPVSEPVMALASGTTYAVCLVVHNAANTEEAVGAAVTFTTVPLPTTGAPSPIGSSTAIFNGELTPLNEEVETEYDFYYNLGETAECTYESAVPAGNAGKGSAAVSVSTEATALEPNQKYTVCLFSFNVFGSEVSPASPAHFETEPAPPTVEGESATPVKATEATLNAVVNPNNEKTKYFFEYSTSDTEVLAGKGTKVAGASELENYGGQGVAALTGAVLEPNKTYYYRVVAENAQSETEPHPAEGTVKSFTTTTPSQEQATPITGTTATLSGALNPAKAGEADAYVFLYRASPSECEGESETSYTSAHGGQGEAVKTELSNLAPHTTYTFCVQEYNEVNEATIGPAVTFKTSAAGVSAGSLVGAEVGATSAKLSAQIDPGGTETTYDVEYGPSEAYSSSTPAVSAGAASGNVGVLVSLEGLQPDTVYHYRFVAKNSFGEASGPDATFTTFPPSASALPDDRTYELVSSFPAGTGEEAYVPTVTPLYISFEYHGIKTGERPFEAAPDGEAVVYAGDATPTGGSGGSGQSNGTEYLATRSAGGGWKQVDLHPPGIKEGSEYVAFSSDLSVGIFESQENELGGGPGEYGELYSHATADGAGGEYRPFNTSTPPYRTPSEFSRGNQFELSKGGYAGGNAGTSVVPAYSHLLFEANDALATLNVAADGGGGEDPVSHLPFAQEHNLYDRVGGGLYLVNVLPDGGTEANASFGQDKTVSEGHGGSDVISADASRIFWTALESESVGRGRAPRALYVRENDTQPQSPLGGLGGEECTVSVDACTVQLDAAQGGPESGGGVFWSASGDGSRVFFTDCRKLTKESTAVPTPDCEQGETAPPVGNDLYEYDLQTGALTDLTVDNADSGGADVQGVLGSGEDGEYVYFAAEGVLASNENADKDKAAAEHDNLYVSHRGTVTFIATLSPQDGSEVQPLAACGQEAECEGDWQADGGHRTSEVTPGGQSVVFMSNQPLTGYDNAANSGEQGPLDEVFVYEAPAGKLTCVSCNPSGEPPGPTEFNTHYFDQPIGGFIPTSRSFAGEQPLVVSDDGSRVFFDSGEPLLPTATNGWLNVYEWERAGTPGGSCPEGAPGGGCVYLISSGTDPENSYLLGTDAGGDNAFFISRAQLTPADRGNEGDVVYDARVDGVQPQPEAACSGTGCQGVPPTPPIFATPSSVTFNGIGNFPPPAKPAVKAKPKPKKCKKNFVKNKQGKCVKAKAKKRKAKKSNRRAK